MAKELNFKNYKSWGQSFVLNFQSSIVLYLQSPVIGPAQGPDRI